VVTLLSFPLTEDFTHDDHLAKSCVPFFISATILLADTTGLPHSKTKHSRTVMVATDRNSKFQFDEG